MILLTELFKFIRVALALLIGNGIINMIESDVTKGNSSMSTVFSPLVSDSNTEEQEAGYTEWLKAKIQASLNDPRPNIPHDKVMENARALLESKRKIRAAG